MSDVAARVAKLSPEKLELLMRRLNQKRGDVSRTKITPQNRESNSLPLSFAQQRLWFLNQLEPSSLTYNLPTAVSLTGPLIVAAMERSINEIRRRHEALRTTFVVEDGQPVQVISPPVPWPLPVVDLTEVTATEQEAEVQQLVQQPFDLTRGPLWRTTLLRLGEEEHVLFLSMHHIVFDDWSFAVFLQELAALYEAFSAGKPSPLAELPIQYADFALWQRQWLQGEALEKQLSYWKQQLDGAPTMVELPTDRPRPAVQTYRGARQYIMLSKQVSEALKLLSQQEEVTLFMVLLAAFGTWLYRYTGQEDILVGSPIAGRNQVETEELIGFFVNTLVMRTYLGGNPTFRQLLARVRQVALGAYSHQDLPFEKLVEELHPERDPSCSSLFQVMFVLQNAPKSVLELSGLSLNFQDIDSGTAKFDLTLELQETTEGIRGWFEYNTDLFDACTVHRMVGHFQTLLEGIVANPEQKLSELPLLTAAERLTLLVEWNNTQADYPKDACIHQMFEAQVELTPNAVAVVFEDQQLTYRELNARANKIAHYLLRLGVGPEVLVGICVERSLEMIVGLLGILKAGGAYVPLDPAYPQERLAFILSDTQTPVLLTQKRLVQSLPKHSAKVVCLDADDRLIAQEKEENPLCGVKASNLAYVMYTSGSTGRPKGVSIIHRGVVRLACGADYANLTSKEVFLQLAPISFDASTFEIWGCLLNGARLVVFPAHTPSLEELGQVVKLHQITTLWLTAGLFHLMVDERLEDLLPLGQLLAGGDVLSVPHVQKVLQELGECRVINGYGPTESTTFTCSHLMTAQSQFGTCVPIGRPISNTKVYILDRYLKPVPAGVSGELYIGGDGLARGYLNQPELTAEKFIPNPFSNEPGARLYKTGDIARYLPNGNIEFLGRTDHQVKLRGFRIELGEIEAVLVQHPAVREAVVIVREDIPGEKRLVAYLIPNQRPAPPVSELRRFLKQELPDYMVPSAFVLLSALPLTPNGKVNRRALPVPDQAPSTLKGNFVAPRDPLEHQLTEIWEELLDIQPIGIHDNFFELGGHSLLAVRMMHQIEQVWGQKLPLSTLFAEATVEHLAKVLLQQNQQNFQSPLVTIQSGGDKRPFFFLHGDWNGGGLYCLNLARYLGKEQPFYALSPHGIDGVQMPLTIEAMAADHLKTLRAFQPEGPYFLGGHCNGALVAFEMARRLQSQGQKVAFLALISAPATNARFNFISGFVNRLGYLFRLDEQRILFLLIPYYVISLADFLRSGIDKQISLIQKKMRSSVERFVGLFPLGSGRDQGRVASARLDLVAQTPEEYRRDLTPTYWKAVKAYIPQPYSGRVTLFWPSELPVEYPELLVDHPNDPTIGWGEVAEAVDVYPIPGGHITVITKHVQALGEKLKVCLDEAQIDDFT